MDCRCFWTGRIQSHLARHEVAERLMGTEVLCRDEFSGMWRCEISTGHIRCTNVVGFRAVVVKTSEVEGHEHGV